MVEDQLRARDIVDQRVLDAMERVPRELFVPAGEQHRAYADAALPIGHGQTISQPYMVARIAEALGLAGGEKVLDVGSGSGYQAAVLAELADEVHTIERIPELAEEARENLAAAGYDRVQVHVGDGSLGLPDEAPFTAIAVAAAAPGLPELLYDQLEPRGRLAVPVGGRWGQRLEVIVRSPEGPAIVHSVPCRFVPLVGEQGFTEVKRAARRRARGRAGRLLQGQTRDRARSLGWPAGSRTRPTAPSRRSSKARTNGSTRWSTGAAAGREALASTTSR